MISLYNNNNILNDNQKMYNNFNEFIFSNDRNVFNKLYYKFFFYNMTKHLIGDIIECGVFKGSGIMSWLKIIDMMEPNTIKKVIGFDFFDPSFVDDITTDVDKKTMKQVFERDSDLDNFDVSVEGITEKILCSGIKHDKFELIKGNIIKTSEKYIKERPGARISILYLDMDLEEPTYVTLKNMWNNIVPGGVVVFDEYGYHSWSESNGVDKFASEMNLSINRTNIKAPTGYIVK